MAKKASKPRSKSKDWRNRIVGHGEESPAKLVANPRNWRCHPDQQRAAMHGALESLGWIDEVTVNRTTGLVVDGHLRVAMAIEHAQAKVPVRYVELTAEEEAAALLTKDPIGSLAGADRDQLRGLLEEFEPANESLDALLADLAARCRVPLTPDEVDPVSGGDPVEELPDDEEPEPGESPPDDPGRSAFAYLRFGKISVPMSVEECELLEKVYQGYASSTGTNFGFARWLVEHVAT